MAPLFTIFLLLGAAASVSTLSCSPLVSQNCPTGRAYCPGCKAVYTCAICNGTGFTVWNINMTQGQSCAPVALVQSSAATCSTASNTDCSPFTAANVNPGMSNPCLNSTLSYQVDSSIHLSSVMCWNGNAIGTGIASTQLVGTVVASVAGPPDPPVMGPAVCIPKNSTHFVANLSWNQPLNNGGNSIDGYYVSTSGGLSPCTNAPCAYNSTTISTTIELAYNLNYSVSVSASNCKGSCDGCGVGGTLGELRGPNSLPLQVNIQVPSLKFGTFCRVYNASLTERLEWIEVVLDNLNIYTSGISRCDTIEYSLVTSEGYSLTRSASECPCHEVIQVSGSSDINVTLAAAQAASGVVLSMVSSTAAYLNKAISTSIQVTDLNYNTCDIVVQCTYNYGSPIYGCTFSYGTHLNQLKPGTVSRTSQDGSSIITHISLARYELFSNALYNYRIDDQPGCANEAIIGTLSAPTGCRYSDLCNVIGQCDPSRSTIVTNNGHWNYNSSDAVLQCDVGYVISGPGYIYCQCNGTWNASIVSGSCIQASKIVPVALVTAVPVASGILLSIIIIIILSACICKWKQGKSYLPNEVERNDKIEETSRVKMSNQLSQIHVAGDHVGAPPKAATTSDFCDVDNQCLTFKDSV